MRPTILTAAGRYFNIAEPESTPVGIEEIAHALSHLCRYTGHVRTFYSVAQHSVAVSHLVPPEHALAGLLHDAAEAFVGDVSSPLKQMLPEYKAIERRVEAAVLGCFGVQLPLHPCIKQADLVMLATEKRDLMPARDDGGEWDCIDGIRPLTLRVLPMTPNGARISFLSRFKFLTEA